MYKEDKMKEEKIEMSRRNFIAAGAMAATTAFTGFPYLSKT
ncbi:twin-arginine translocation signal domain-containing protein, partial [bacterium]|nr:twin-arginine translocation signal domain-containing protein [bacterium]